MNITRALTIEGFTNPVELEWLARQASRCQRVAEVGAWMGRSTVAMAENLPPGGVLYAVDTWKGTPVEHDKWLAGKPEAWLMDTFGENVGKELFAPPAYKVRALQEPSVEASEYLTGRVPGGFDMIFIDAAHDYENVCADIRAWRKLLKPGGLLCGHDFDKGRPGVVRAVRELVPDVRFAFAGSIWYQPTNTGMPV